MVLPSISRLNPISAISNELPSLSAFNPLQAVKKDLPPSLLSAFATLGNMFERNDKKPDEDVRKVVRNIRTQSKSRPNTSTASVAGTAIRVGFKGPGETFKKNGNEYTVPDGFLYNEKTARMVQTTSIGTMPFRSFAFAGIDPKQSIFDNYRVQLFRRLDKIIDIMSKLTVSSPEDVVPGTPEREEESDPTKEDKDKKSGWDWLLSFFKKFIIDPILKALRKVISWIKSFIRSVVGAIFRVIGKVLETIKRIGRVVVKYIKEIISYVKSALGPLWNTAAKFLGKAAKSLTGAASTAGKKVLSSLPGISKLFAGLGTAGKNIPILGAMITPVLEGFEADSKLKELVKQKENGEITEQEFRQKSTEAVTQATMNTLGTVGGALIGSLFGPLGTVAGGLLGNQLARFVGDSLTPKLAAAINTNDVDQIVKDIVEFFSKDIPNFFSSIPDRIRSAFSGNTATKVLEAFEDSKNSVSDLLGSGWNSVKDTTKSGLKWAKKKIGVHSGDIPSSVGVERLEDSPHSTKAISPQNSIAVSPVPVVPAKPLAVPDYGVGSSDHTVIIDNTKTTIVRNTNIPAPNYGYGYQNRYNPMAA